MDEKDLSPSCKVGSKYSQVLLIQGDYKSSLDKSLNQDINNEFDQVKLTL